MKKLLFAPMATLSHEAMRLTIERCAPLACDEYYTEMIQATSFLAGGKFEPYYVRTGPDVSRIVWQLTCGKAQPLADAASALSSYGGIGIDLNMGCCAPEIVKQGAGISWMLKPLAETEQMVQNVRRAMDDSLRLSVKMRLGDENFTENSLFSFVDMLVHAGVTRIVLHPRTRHEKFRRTPHWEYAQKLAAYVRSRYGSTVSVCGNGDITDVRGLCSVLQKAPDCDGFMLGRAVVQKPWLFAQLRAALAQSLSTGACGAAGVVSGSLAENTANERANETCSAEQGVCYAPCSEDNSALVCTRTENGIQFDLQEIALGFLRDLRECQPKEFWLTRAQRFFAYFSANFSFAHYVAVQTSNAHSLEEVENAFLTYLQKMPQERYVIISAETSL